MPRDMLTELKQKKPFPNPEEELCLSLIRTADLLGRGVYDLLKVHDLSTTQYNTLRILRGAGEKGMPCGDIGSRLVTRDPDVTRLLERMRLRGLISRQRFPGDRRVITARITPAGLSVLRVLDRPMARAHRKQLGFFPGSETRVLLRQLMRIRENLA